jgi:hypothetical protein
MAISDKNIRITKNTNTPPGNFPKMVFTGSSAGASVVTLEVLDDNTLSFSSNEGQIFSLDSNLTSGTIWSVNDVSGVALLRASAGATIGLVETVGVVGIGESLPNPGIYKLQVRGQVAFGSTADTNSHFIFNTSSSSTNTNSFQLRRGALAQFFEDGDVLKTTFRANAAQSADANYIWPIGLPAAVGSSVLQSDTSGNLSWVPLAASGGGSGTVNSGTAGSVAFYTADGTSVSGTGLIQVPTSGTAVSVFTNLDLRSQNDVRFFNATNSNFASIQASNVTNNYTLSLPTAPVGFGFSVLLVGNDGQMYFAPVSGGLASSTWGTNIPNLRMKMNHHIWFSAGYTPLAAGADNVTFVVPDASTDGTADLTFFLKEFQVRVETPSAGSSRIQIEKSSTNTGAFTLAATGSSLIAGSGLTISGAGIYVTSTTTFPAGIFVTSNDLLRLNWTLLNATHANFSVTLTIEEI